MTSLQPSTDEPIHLGGDPYWTQRIEKFNKAEGREDGLNNIKEATKVTICIPLSCLIHTFSTRRFPSHLGLRHRMECVCSVADDRVIQFDSSGQR